MMAIMSILSALLAQIILAPIRRSFNPKKKFRRKREPIGALLLGNFYYWYKANRVTNAKK